MKRNSLPKVYKKYKKLEKEFEKAQGSPLKQKRILKQALSLDNEFKKIFMSNFEVWKDGLTDEEKKAILATG